MHPKNGETWITKEAVIMVLAALLIIASYSFFGRVQAAFFSEKDDGSIANFDRLHSKVKALIDDGNAVKYDTANYFLNKDKILVGFDTDWDDSKKVLEYTLWADYSIYKPYKCGNSACLCLYTTDWEPGNAAKRDTAVISCKTFAGRKIRFSSSVGSGSDRGDGTLHLIFFGDDLDGEDFGTQPMYIEKKYENVNGMYNIYISKIDSKNPDNPATSRMQAIDNLRK